MKEQKEPIGVKVDEEEGIKAVTVEEEEVEASIMKKEEEAITLKEEDIVMKLEKASSFTLKGSISVKEEEDILGVTEDEEGEEEETEDRISTREYCLKNRDTNFALVK